MRISCICFSPFRVISKAIYKSQLNALQWIPSESGLPVSLLLCWVIFLAQQHHFAASLQTGLIHNQFNCQNLTKVPSSDH